MGEKEMTLKDYGDVIDWLRRYLESQEEEERLAEEILRLDSRKEKVTSALTATTGGSGAKAGAFTYTIEQIDDMKAQLAATAEKTIVIRTGIEALINTLPEHNQRRVIRLLYLTGLSVTKAAQRMGYDRKTIYRIHLSALDHIYNKTFFPKNKRCPTMSHRGLLK